jgi:hypothetical protein
LRTCGDGELGRLPSNVRHPALFELLFTAPFRWAAAGAALFMRGAEACPDGPNVCAGRALAGRCEKLVLAFTRGIDRVFTLASDMRRDSADALNGSLPCTEPARARSLFEARTKLFVLTERPRLKSLAAMLVTPLRPFTNRALRKLLSSLTLLAMVVLLKPRPYHGRKRS